MQIKESRRRSIESGQGKERRISELIREITEKDFQIDQLKKTAFGRHKIDASTMCNELEFIDDLSTKAGELEQLLSGQEVKLEQLNGEMVSLKAKIMDSNLHMKSRDHFDHEIEKKIDKINEILLEAEGLGRIYEDEFNIQRERIYEFDVQVGNILGILESQKELTMNAFNPEGDARETIKNSFNEIRTPLRKEFELIPNISQIEFKDLDYSLADEESRYEDGKKNRSVESDGTLSLPNKTDPANLSQIFFNGNEDQHVTEENNDAKYDTPGFQALLSEIVNEKGTDYPDHTQYQEFNPQESIGTNAQNEICEDERLNYYNCEPKDFKDMLSKIGMEDSILHDEDAFHKSYRSRSSYMVSYFGVLIVAVGSLFIYYVMHEPESVISALGYRFEVPV